MRREVWIGLDVGTRRIGVAKSDPLGLTAQPHSTVPRTGGTRDIEQIIALAEEEDATGFVLGLPLRTDGSHGPEVQKVLQFAEALRALTPLPVEWVDERFTTVMAQRTLREQGLRGPARRRHVDQVAAALILQTFLDRRRERDARERSDHSGR